MGPVSILLDHTSCYNHHCLFSLFTHLKTTSFDVFEKQLFKLNTVSFTQIFQDSVDIFED